MWPFNKPSPEQKADKLLQYLGKRAQNEAYAPPIMPDGSMLPIPYIPQILTQLKTTDPASDEFKGNLSDVATLVTAINLDHVKDWNPIRKWQMKRLHNAIIKDIAETYNIDPHNPPPPPQPKAAEPKRSVEPTIEQKTQPPAPETPPTPAPVSEVSAEAEDKSTANQQTDIMQTLSRAGAAITASAASLSNGVINTLDTSNTILTKADDTAQKLRGTIDETNDTIQKTRELAQQVGATSGKPANKPSAAKPEPQAQTHERPQSSDSEPTAEHDADGQLTSEAAEETDKQPSKPKATPKPQDTEMLADVKGEETRQLPEKLDLPEITRAPQSGYSSLQQEAANLAVDGLSDFAKEPQNSK